MSSAILVGYALFFRPLLEEKAFWVVAAFVLFSPTVHPWYLLWVFPLSIICMQRSWRWLYTAYPLFYVALLTLEPDTGVWEPPIWPQVFTYLPFLGCLLWDWFKVRLHWKEALS